MEFLIGRSLANNVTQSARSPHAAGRQAEASIGSRCSRRNPTLAWGMALGRLAASSWTRWRPCSSRPWATGCVRIRHLPPVHPGRLATRRGGHGRRRTRGRCAAARAGGSAAQLLVRGARRLCAPSLASRPPCLACRLIARWWATAARPSTRCACGAPHRPNYFNFQEFSSGDFVGALAETLTAESVTRVLYPDDSTSMGQGLRFVQEYFSRLCAGRSGAASRAATPTGAHCRRKSPSSSMIRTRRWRCPS